MNKKITPEEFLHTCQNVHKGKNYDFSVTHYVNAKTLVNVKCLEKNENGVEHGIFQIRPDHLRNGHGCPKCSGRYKNINIFINKALLIHNNKYEYSKVKENERKWLIICPIHGEFYQDKYAHLRGCGCPKCNNGVVQDTEEFIQKARIIHGNIYDYSKVEYINSHTKVCIICPIHGEFWQSPDSHLRQRGCPLCSNNGKQPKKKGYWDNKKHCIEEVQKYKNKNQLQKKCYGCYQGMIRNGWYNELASKYLTNEIFYMDYNSPINIVYAYIIEQFNTVYVGRTNKLHRRDKQHRNGIKHSDGRIDYDGLASFCQNKNIDIPQPTILEDYLTAEESQIKEDEWKNKFLNEGYDVLNKAATGKGVGSLGATMKWNYEKCKEVALLCKNRYEMKQTNQSAYQSCLRNGWLDEFFPNKKLSNGYWEIKENVQNEAYKYTNAKEFAIKGGGAYNAARKKGFLSSIKYKSNEDK